MRDRKINMEKIQRKRDGEKVTLTQIQKDREVDR